VENIVHTLFGLAMARAGLDRHGPAATAACVIGANLPDADGVMRFFGDSDSYLLHHRGITHSFFGVAVQTAVLAYGLDFIARKRHVPTPGPLCLAIVSALALLSHLALDWTNTYGVRLLLPFSERRIHGDLFFIVDPWLWLLFGGALAWHAPKGRWTTVALASLFLVFVAIIGLSGRAPGWRLPAFLAGGAVIALGRVLGVLREDRRAPLGALALTGVYALAVLALREVATARVAPEIGPSALSVARIPQPADPVEWDVLVETETEMRRASVSALADGRREWVAVPRNLDDARVRAALETPSGRAIERFARFLCAEIGRDAKGRTVVFLRDARYAFWPVRSGGFGARAVTLDDLKREDAAPPAR